VEAALPGMAERLDAEILLLNFGNAVGFFRLPELGLVEVCSGKWDQADWERMLRDLTELALGLPFAAEVAAALPYDRSVAMREDVLYHMFVYLRHILATAAARHEHLLPALQQILQAPHQRFERVQREVSLPQARQVDAASLARLVSGQSGLASVSGTVYARLPLARTFNGYLPLRVHERHVEVDYDTAENRFVKSFVSSAEAIIERMRALMRERRADAFRQRILVDCDVMSRALRPVIQHQFWQEVGSMAHVPASSPVLQRRRGYREVYGHWARLRLAAHIPLDPATVRDLLEGKDIALLYELWCFFVLVREVEQQLGSPAYAGRPQASPLEISIKQGLEVRWADGTRVLYNQSFSRPHGSYSVTLRPDIALHVPSGPNAGLHLLDAKFKLDRLTTLIPETEDAAEDRADERRGTYKRADLYKMHTYRDAIRETRSVWILYPGDAFRFYSREPLAVVPSTPLPHLLNGVGAIPLQPDSEHAELQIAVRRLLGQEG
jgi:predicted component of viral defense system (DUF524 family)